MRYDHIVELNEQLEAAKDAADESIAALKRDHERLEAAHKAIGEKLPILKQQIQDAEEGRAALSQLAATGAVTPARENGGKRSGGYLAMDKLPKDPPKSTADATETVRQSLNG